MFSLRAALRGICELGEPLRGHDLNSTLSDNWAYNAGFGDGGGSCNASPGSTLTFGNTILDVATNSVTGQQMVGDAATLEAFNEGFLTDGCTQ